MENKKKNPLLKGCLIAVVIGASLMFIVLIIAVIFAGDKSVKQEKVDEIAETVELNKDSLLRVQLKREIESLANYKREKCTDVSSVILYIAVFNARNIIIEEGLSSGNEENIKLANTLRSREVNIQKSEYPKLRKEYADALAQKVWENDMYVFTSGNNNTVINFTNAAFAANMNIKEFQTEVQDVLKSLRFKQARYRWYKGASEYTYYDLDVPADTAPVTSK